MTFKIELKEGENVLDNDFIMKIYNNFKESQQKTSLNNKFNLIGCLPTSFTLNKEGKSVFEFIVDKIEFK